MVEWDGMDLLLKIFLVGMLLVAAVSDLRTQRIPNMLTFPSMVVGLVCSAYTGGFQGLTSGAAGLLLGLILMIPFYIMSGMGAGDVKLMGAVGSILGPQGVFTAFLYSAIAGGVYALLLLARNRALSQTANRYGGMLKGYLCTGQVIYIPPEDSNLPRLCYGLAISLGTILSILRPL